MNLPRLKRFLLGLHLICGLLAPAMPVWAASFQGLGNLSGSNTSRATGVSADGNIVVGVEGGSKAIRWTSQTGMVDLGDLVGGGSRSNANAVSADGGTIVGAGDSSNGKEAFL